MLIQQKNNTNSVQYAEIDDRFFLFGSIDPRLPATILAILQILFSLSCLITASVYVDVILRQNRDAETSVVLGFGLTIFVIQILFSSCTLYAFYSSNASLVLCQTIWQLVSPVIFGILCAVVINKFVTTPLFIGYILILVTFISTPICAVDASMVLIFFRCYQLLKNLKKHEHSSTCFSNPDLEMNSTSSPATLTLSSLNASLHPVDYYDDRQRNRMMPIALVPSTPIPTHSTHLTETQRRNPLKSAYSIIGRRKTQHRATAASYSSMIWTQGDSFAELIHRTPTGQFVLNLREEGTGDTHTEA